MIDTLAWAVALAAIALGGFASFIPGFPGCAVAWIGLVAYAGLTDFSTLPPSALVVGGLLVAGAALVQVASPAIMSRALGGTAGAATGAALGASLGALVPIPLASVFGGFIGAALLGIAFSREGVVAALRGIFGAATGCGLSIAVDFVAVVGIGAILALTEFVARLP